MELMFEGPASIADAGIFLTLPGAAPRKFYFTFHGLIGDSPAVQQFWGTLGSCGTTPPVVLDLVSRASVYG